MRSLVRNLKAFVLNVAELFRTKTRDSVEQASHYMEGLLGDIHRKNMERMEETIPGSSKQNLQQFISDSPWSHEKVMDHVASQAANFLGPHPDLCLLIDESCFTKKGDKSAGVARQWNGRLGKVDNCQVGVFCTLNRGIHTAVINASLYLPKAWTEDPERCLKAGIPKEEIIFRDKCEIAFGQVRDALAGGIRPGWIGVDAGYGKNVRFLQRLEDELGVCFMADIPHNRRVWLERPDVENTPCRKLVKMGVKASALAKSLEPGEWEKIRTRTGPGGHVEVLAWAKQVWIWSGRKKDAPRKWWLL